MIDEIDRQDKKKVHELYDELLEMSMMFDNSFIPLNAIASVVCSMVVAGENPYNYMQIVIETIERQLEEFSEQKLQGTLSLEKKDLVSGGKLSATDKEEVMILSDEIFKYCQEFKNAQLPMLSLLTALSSIIYVNRNRSVAKNQTIDFIERATGALVQVLNKEVTPAHEEN